jgi:hypothetical protein
MAPKWFRQSRQTVDNPDRVIGQLELVANFMAQVLGPNVNEGELSAFVDLTGARHPRGVLEAVQTHPWLATSQGQALLDFAARAAGSLTLDTAQALIEDRLGWVQLLIETDVQLENLRLPHG